MRNEPTCGAGCSASVNTGRYLLLLLLGATAAGACGALGAQVTPVAECRRPCEMVPELVVQLGELDGPGALGNPAYVVQRHNGEWVVGDYHRPGELVVFGPDGSFSRVVGRSGNGPGEYESVDRLRVLPGDSLEVVDLGLLRITTLTPSLRVARTRRLGPDATSIAFLADGRHVVGANVRSAMSIGLPVHLVSREGEIVRSFGADPALERIDRSDVMRRDLAPAGEGAIWSAHLLRYEIERWDSTGTRTLVLRRELPGFPPQQEYSGVRSDASTPPTPGLVWIRSDARGRLWTSIRVPDADYRRAFVEGHDPYGRAARVIGDPNDYFDTVIEVIDPVAGRVVGRARVGEDVRGFTGEDQCFSVIHLRAGDPRLRVWRLSPPPLPPEGG